MKHFFNYNLSSRKVVLPVLGMIVLGAVYGILGSSLFPEADPMAGTIMDSRFYWSMVGFLALSWLMLVVLCGLMFPLTVATFEAAGYEGENVKTDYHFGDYMRLTAVGSLLTILTAGIYAPWFCVRLTRYFCEGASWRLRYFGFHAKGMGLFAIITLLFWLPYMVLLGCVMGGTMLLPTEAAPTTTAVLASVVGTIVFVLWMALFCVVVTRWMMNLSIGDERVVCDMHVGRATLFLAGQMVLTLLTLGLYTPMMELRLMQYVAENTKVGEGEGARYLGMRLRAWRDWGYVWLQMLLTIITLGIYLPWYYTKILNRFIPRLYVEER